nr:hypothetical protein [uncultured Massilia sp.]
MIARLAGMMMAAALAWPCHAASDVRSAKNDYFVDNPFIAIGVNPTTHVLTGYFSVLRTAPGRTDECKFVFRGVIAPDRKVRLSIKDAALENQNDVPQHPTEFATLTATNDAVHIDLPKSLAPGDCDWLLGWVGGPGILEREGGFDLAVHATPTQEWIGVAAIRSKRAFFHTTPDEGTVRKAFVVAGNVVYVLEEKPGWFRVKFTHAARETTGWIKVADTVQF